MTVNGVTTDYTYNGLDQLISAGSITYDYDDRGDLSSITNGSNITNYTYDAADRLTGVTAPGVTASYGYDADGRRVTQSFNGQVTNSLWDEASPYGDVVYEYSSSGSTLASYVLGGTQLVSQTRGSATSYFLQDGQGSTRALTNGSGTVTDTYSYTAFGELFNQTGTTTNSYLYTGQQFDSLTGLYSLRARYYNPALGRFLSQDTYPYNFSNPIELNRYVYTANDPINRMDPSGHLFIEYAPNLLQSAARGAALGTLGGAVYGIVMSLVCTGRPDLGFVGRSMLGGAIGGAMVGAAIWTGVAGLPGLVTMGLGTAGSISAYGAMRAYGANPCTVINALASVATVLTGFAGIVGGTPLPPGLQPVWVGANSGTSASAVSGTGVSPNVLTGSGAISLASRISGGDDNDYNVLGGGTPSPKGRRLSELAREIYVDNLKLWWERLQTTVALTDVRGRLYGTVNGGSPPSAVAKVKAAIEDLGGEFIPNPYGPESHAEVFLYEEVSGVKTIGISNTRGPCPACSEYFRPLIGQVEIVYP